MSKKKLSIEEIRHYLECTSYSDSEGEDFKLEKDEEYVQPTQSSFSDSDDYSDVFDKPVEMPECNQVTQFPSSKKHKSTDLLEESMYIGKDNTIWHKQIGNGEISARFSQENILNEEGVIEIIYYFLLYHPLIHHLHQ
nr:uncharacterized protein LOC121118202 [Lepeophtheirus salmonis]